MYADIFLSYRKLTFLRMQFWAILLLCFFSNAEAYAQNASASVSECGAYDPNPKCTEETRSRLHKSFGLPALEEMQKKTSSRRTNNPLIIAIIEMKNGAGLALVFRNDRKGVPSVKIYRQRSKQDGRRYPPLRAAIPKEAWDRVITKGNALDDVFAREEVYLCGASFTIEIVDTAGKLRSPVGDSCGHEPRSVYFNILARTAIEQMPHCAALQPEAGEDDVYKLLACFQTRNNKKEP
jgi:hypothetical protein